MIRIAMSNGWKRPRGSFQVADEGLRKHGCQRRPRGSFQVADEGLRKHGCQRRPRGSFQVADISLRKQAICSPFGR